MYFFIAVFKLWQVGNMAKTNSTQYIIKKYQEFLKANEADPELNLKKSDIPYLVLAAVIREASDGHSKNSAAQRKHEAVTGEAERKHQRFTQLFNKSSGKK